MVVRFYEMKKKLYKTRTKQEKTKTIIMVHREITDQIHSTNE